MTEKKKNGSGALAPRQGDSRRRTPLVMLPGLLCDGALWAPQALALSDFAECWIPESLSEDTMSAMAQAVLRDVPFERFALAGLSMGGYVCMEIMRQAPHSVDALALLDTRAPPDSAEDTQRRRDFMRLAQTSRGFIQVTRRLLPQLIHASRLSDEVLIGNVQAMAARTGVDAYVRQLHAIISRPDSRGDMPNWYLPSLVLCGRQDALTTPAMHEEMASLLPDAELVVIEECGHMSTLEKPEEVAVVMRRWLQRIED